MNATADQVDTTFVKMMAGVASDTRELVAAHAKQLRAEVSNEMKRGRNAALLLAIGGTLGMIGVAFIGVGLIPLLVEQFGLPEWAAWMFEGAGLLALGTIGAVWGWQRLHAIRPIPKRSLQSLHESWQWITNN